MIVLGIDPGTIRMGYAFVEYKNDKLQKVHSVGFIDISDISEHSEKLKIIFEELEQLIEKFTPEEMAIEAPFYGKNVQSMLKLGRAQGIAMAIGFINRMSVTEYSPKKIKLSITGNGNASKEQVAAVLKNIISFNYNEKYYDATDALAVAVCHCFHKKNILKSVLPPKKKSPPKNPWKFFLEKNPNRKI